MRIAYVAPYQGSELLRRRPVVANLALAANLKMELVAELLLRDGSHVEIISQGEVVERRAELYPAFDEAKPFHRQVPVRYAAALPVQFLNGVMSALWTVKLLIGQHVKKRFHLVLVYNLKPPQMLAAVVAKFILRLPVILEHEDDVLVELSGEEDPGIRVGLHRRISKFVLRHVSGCIGASPHLVSRVPTGVPGVLLRGVVSEEILNQCDKPSEERERWVAYSGTLFRSKGLDQLIAAWETVAPEGWELHIAGDGEKADLVRDAARRNPRIIYHGLLDREQNAKLLARARIGMNAHDLSATPGNVFAFKIVEYLAAGLHVISTPMGPLEARLEEGITYIPDNAAGTIADALRQVLASRAFERTATQASRELYGPAAVRKRLGELVRHVVSSTARSPSE